MSTKPPNDESKIVLVTADALRDFTEALLGAEGVPPENAKIVAKCLVEANLRGVDTHGVNRIPSYVARLRKGVLNGRASPQVEKKTAVIAQVDGENTFGALSAHLAMSCAVEMAETHGIGMVSVKHSNHFGMSASYVLRAIERDMMCMVFTNSSPAMPVWGGTERLLGVSPIACGAPAGDKPPFVLDMAPSMAARGKVHRALSRGETIPDGWAFDHEGQPTTDPAAALQGVMLPIGGPKGSGLALMMDIFSGVFSGSAFGGDVVGPYDPSKPADVGHFMLTMKPDLFISLQDFKDRMDQLYRRVTEAERLQGVHRIYYPGEIEAVCQRDREQNGIPMSMSEVKILNRVADEAGSPELAIDP